MSAPAIYIGFMAYAAFSVRLLTAFVALRAKMRDEESVQLTRLDVFIALPTLVHPNAIYELPAAVIALRVFVELSVCDAMRALLVLVCPLDA